METSGYLERPDYRVDLLRRRNLVTATLDGVVLAQTSAAILVDEQDHGLVCYFPASDVRFDQLVPTGDSSRCPYKGIANYWRSVAGTEPVAWGYRDPYPEVIGLLDHVAFYQDRVQVSVGVATPAVVGYSG